MTYRRDIAAVVGALVIAGLMAPSATRGDVARTEIAAVIGGDNNLTEGTLIGTSGQVFEPDQTTPGTWQRQFGGGIGVPVRTALKVDSGPLFAAGPRAPIFRLDEPMWHAHPMANRGPTILAHGGVPALALGRHIYIWKHARWDRLTTLESRVTALWASGARRIFAATANNKLVRIQQNRPKTRISHSLASDDKVTLLVGHPGTQVYGISRQHQILHLKARTATLVIRDATWATWEPQAAAVDHTGVLWILGWVPGTDTSPGQAHLARVENDQFVMQQSINDLSEGDRFRVLHIDKDRRMLFSTASGIVRFSSGPAAQGSATGTISWLDAALIGEVPIPVSGFPAQAPAHTR